MRGETGATGVTRGDGTEGGKEGKGEGGERGGGGGGEEILAQGTGRTDQPKVVQEVLADLKKTPCKITVYLQKASFNSASEEVFGSTCLSKLFWRLS